MLFVVIIFGLIISLNAAPSTMTASSSGSKTWPNLKYSKSELTWGRPKMPKSVKKLGTNITDYRLNLGSIKSRGFSKKFADYEVAALNAIDLFQRKEDARGYIFDFLKSQTYDNQQVYKAGIVGSYFDGNRENIINNINTIVDEFMKDVQSESAKSDG